MNLLPVTGFRIFNLGTLRLAASLVPRRQRAEWLKEWQAELWHVRQACCTEGGTRWQAEQSIAAFCFGAFQDALCLRKNSRTRVLPRQYFASAAKCVLFLAGLAIATYCLAMFLPGARSAVQLSPYRNAQNLMLITHAGYAETSIPTIRADQFRLWRDRKQHLFSAFAFYEPIVKYVAVTPHNAAELSIARSSRNLFNLLGLPVRQASHDRAARNGMPGLVITDSVWKKYFGEDPHISGRIVRVGIREAEVVGVIPTQRWSLPGKIDAWLLESDEDIAAIPPNTKGFLIGRLKPSPKHAGFSGHWNLSAPTSPGHTVDLICDSVASRTRGPFSIFVFTVILAFLALPATTPLPLGEYPTARHKLSWSKKIRRWIFLATKIVLVLPIVYFGSLDLAYLNASINPITSQYIQIIASFCICLFALRWTLRDQRQRCPVCLGKLTHPARVGHPSRTFLAWNGTELICVGGHGLLHVPEMPTSWFSTQRWLYLDPSWEVLFPEAQLISSSIP
jgi:hypothetical protein